MLLLTITSILLYLLGFALCNFAMDLSYSEETEEVTNRDKGVAFVACIVWPVTVSVGLIILWTALFKARRKRKAAEKERLRIEAELALRRAMPKN